MVSPTRTKHVEKKSEKSISDLRIRRVVLIPQQLFISVENGEYHRIVCSFIFILRFYKWSHSAQQ